MWSISNIKNLVILPFFIHLLSFWIPSTIYAALDWYGSKNESFMLKYKLQGDQIIKKGGIDLSHYRETAIKALENQGWFLLFLFMTLPVVTLRGISLEQSLPSIHKLLIDAGITTFILSFLFYYIHRILHLPYFYKRYHKIHHEWQQPVACSAIYGHPLDHIMNNVVPVFAPTVLLGLHPYQLYILIVIVTIHSVNVHSGYNFAPFYYSVAKDHDNHHRYFLCNYGAGLDWFDRFHKTCYTDIQPKSD